MWFNLCYHGACKKKALYVTTDGYGYCFRHTVMLLEEYGIDIFWPHYHQQIINDIDKDDTTKKKRAEKRLKESLKEREINVVLFRQDGKKKLEI